jgi:hypothetical protein
MELIALKVEPIHLCVGPQMRTHGGHQMRTKSGRVDASDVQLEGVYQAIASLYEIRRVKEVNLYLGVELRWSKRLGGAVMLQSYSPRTSRACLCDTKCKILDQSQLQCWRRFLPFRKLRRIRLLWN